MLRIGRVNGNNFKDIPNPCRYCLYWQTSGEFSEEMLKPEMEQKKREWFSKAEKEFDGCLKIAYFNGVPIGFVQYAPAKFFLRVKEYASGPPSEDAIFIACLYITNKATRGKGIGTTILKELISEVTERGFRVVETFARKSSTDNPSGPSEFYLKHNFKIRNDKDDFPLLRLEL